MQAAAHNNSSPASSGPAPYEGGEEPGPGSSQFVDHRLAAQGLTAPQGLTASLARFMAGIGITGRDKASATMFSAPGTNTISEVNSAR